MFHAEGVRFSSTVAEQELDDDPAKGPIVEQPVNENEKWHRVNSSGHLVHVLP